MATLSPVSRGAARVGRAAGSVERGVEAVSGLLVDLRRGLKLVFQAAQSVSEQGEILQETNRRLAALESRLEEKLKDKEA